MAVYQHLSIVEREEISRALALSQSFRSIARKLNRSPSTITREIHRHHHIAQGYRAVFAQRHAYKSAHRIRKRRKLDQYPELKSWVLQHLQKNWSPEQIAKRLRVMYPHSTVMQLSHESIYSYVYIQPRGTLKKELVRALRRHHKHRRLRDKIRLKSCPIQDYLSIDERPAEVASRSVPGHWEGDLIMGRHNASALGVLVERNTRMSFLFHVKNRSAQTARLAFSRPFRNLPEGLKQTLTYDHGQEMAEHKLFTKNTRIQVYFAHPHCPWERGTNENTNSLIRQFFPHGTDFSKISRYRVKQVQDLLNDRPRKTLNFLTPHEVFSKLLLH
jgi:IS30 family transposase